MAGSTMETPPETPLHSVWIPALYRDLTGGAEIVEVAATSIAELVDTLEERYPGIKERLVKDDRIRPHVAVSINNEISPRGLRQRLRNPSEVHFVPAMGGG